MIDPRITEYSCLTHTLGTIGGLSEQWERWNWLYKEVVRPLLDGERGLRIDPRAGAGIVGGKAQAKRQAPGGSRNMEEKS